MIRLRKFNNNKDIHKIKYDISFYNDSNNLFYSNNLKHFDEVPGCYIYSVPMDSYMHSLGAIIGCAVNLQFGNQVVPTILIDSNFENLPEYVQRFILYHEAGHIMNKDLENLTDTQAKRIMLRRLFGKLPKMEIEADAFSALMIGFKDTLKALKFLAFKTDLPKNSRKEIYKRFLILKKKERTTRLLA